MKLLLSLLTLMSVTLMLSACSSSDKKLKAYEGTTPELYLEQYFSGPVKVHGILQDFKGNITRRIEGDIYGVWEGKKGKLYEVFYYDDGEVYKRIWHLQAETDGTFSGTAHDIVGKAKGSQEGHAAFWQYVMEVPVGDKVYKLDFDDRMWLLENGALFNKTKLKKFGITVANLTIFMQKQEETELNRAKPGIYETIEVKK